MAQAPDWYAQLLETLKLDTGDDASHIMRRTDAVASALAPNTRRQWKWLLLLEGVAVVLPLLWLVTLHLRWQPLYTALAVLVCAALLIASCWWVRWKGMQHSWIRARLVAEIGRSLMATRPFGPTYTVRALWNTAPLKAIAEDLAHRVTGASANDAVSENDYCTCRIQNQLDYYQTKRADAQKERERLSKFVTRALDSVLFLGVAGLVLVVNDAGIRMLRLSGANYILGVMGAALPLSAIILQSLSSYMELNRRTGRFSHQIKHLEALKDRYLSAGTDADRQEVVKDTESLLLGEVVEWFYEVEHTETFYRAQKQADDLKPKAVEAVEKKQYLSRFLDTLQRSSGYVARVFFGRAIIVGFSMILTTALIAYYAPKDYEERSLLRQEFGTLLTNASDAGWNPDSDRGQKGLILIAHGLHDGVDRKGESKPLPHWMTRLQAALEANLGNNAPAVALVDWKQSAKPSRASIAGLDAVPGMADQPTSLQGWLQDVAAIRPTAEEIGQTVGFKLAIAIHEGRIGKDRPLHLIGHSAGGFVVTEAAYVLQALGFAGNNLRVTILDTPFPNVPAIDRVLESSPVDFYTTSYFAQGVPPAGYHPRFSRFDVVVPQEIDGFTGAHSYVYDWYIDSITTPDERGFLRSPFSQ